ncbi:MAG: UDP-N-acetylmuramate dehydrogenase [Candidatus Aminicenantaceae bacterium]
MADRDFYIYFLEKVEKPLEQDVLLSRYSNFRIGGKADYFFEANSIAEIKSSISAANSCRIPCYLVGGGYNILFDDDGFRGLIIRNKVKGIMIREQEGVEVLSGTSLDALLQFLTEKSLTGLEFLAGIPGTVGGAVFGNAGAFDQCIGDFLKEAFLLDEKGNDQRVERDYFKFSYRQSNLRKRHRVLLKAFFQLRKGDKKKIEKKIGENLRIRKEKHPSEDTACAGSYFKNPVLSDSKKVAAGFLLDKVGAKNIQIGRAAVHPDHANFIINLDKASARDVLSLAQELKERVKEKFGIELEEEVVFLPTSTSIP